MGEFMGVLLVTLFYLGSHERQGVHAMGRPPQATQHSQATAGQEEANQQGHNPNVTAQGGGRREGELRVQTHTHTDTDITFGHSFHSPIQLCSFLTSCMNSSFFKA